MNIAASVNVSKSKWVSNTMYYQTRSYSLGSQKHCMMALNFSTHFNHLIRVNTQHPFPWIFPNRKTTANRNQLEESYKYSRNSINNKFQAECETSPLYEAKLKGTQKM